MNFRYPIFIFVGFVVIVLFLLLRKFIDVRSRLLVGNLAYLKQTATFKRFQKQQRLMKIGELVCLSLCLVSLSMLLARPYTRYEVQTASDASDIIIVLDASRSMEEYLPRTAELLEEFVASQPGNRIGLVIVSGLPSVVAPPSADHARLLEVLDDLQSTSVDNFLTTWTEVSEGSAIGNSLVVAQELFGRDNPRQKIMLTITDGVNNRGMSIVEAAELIAPTNIQTIVVYALTAYNLGDEKAVLEALATTSHGQFLSMDRASDLLAVFGALNERVVSHRPQIQYREIPQAFIAIAILSWSGWVLFKRGLR